MNKRRVQQIIIAITIINMIYIGLKGHDNGPSIWMIYDIYAMKAEFSNSILHIRCVSGGCGNEHNMRIHRRKSEKDRVKFFLLCVCSQFVRYGHGIKPKCGQKQDTKGEDEKKEEKSRKLSWKGIKERKGKQGRDKKSTRT